MLLMSWWHPFGFSVDASFVGCLYLQLSVLSCLPIGLDCASRSVCYATMPALLFWLYRWNPLCVVCFVLVLVCQCGALPKKGLMVFVAVAGVRIWIWCWCWLCYCQTTHSAGWWLTLLWSNLIFSASLNSHWIEIFPFCILMFVTWLGQSLSVRTYGSFPPLLTKKNFCGFVIPIKNLWLWMPLLKYEQISCNLFSNYFQMCWYC